MTLRPTWHRTSWLSFLIGLTVLGPSVAQEQARWTDRANLGGRRWILARDYRPPGVFERDYEDIVAGRVGAAEWGGMRAFKTPARRALKRRGRVHPPTRGLYFHLTLANGVVTIFRIEVSGDKAGSFVLKDMFRAKGALPDGARIASERRGKVVVIVVFAPSSPGALPTIPLRSYLSAAWPDEKFPRVPREPPPPLRGPKKKPLLSRMAGPDPDGREWRARIQLAPLAAYFRYTESMSAASQGDYEADLDALGSGFSLQAKANVHGFTPFLDATMHLAEGEERRQSHASIPFPYPRKTDARILQGRLDLGLGYRLSLTKTLRLTPRVGYTIDLWQVDREEGARGLLFSSQIPGESLRKITDRSFSQGVSVGLDLELDLAWNLLGKLHLTYTNLYSMRVKNESTTDFVTDGLILRGGLSVAYWLRPQISLQANLGGGLRVQNESDTKIFSSPTFFGIVRAPRARAVWGQLGVGVQLAF